MFVLGAIIAAVWAWNWWFPDVAGKVERILSAAFTAEAAIRSGSAGAAMPHVEQAVSEAAAWYCGRSMRLWSLRAAMSIVIGFGGLLGTALLFRQIALIRDQNAKLDAQIELLQAQNDKLDQQTVTGEAQRRGALSTEMFALLQAATQLPPGDAPQREIVARIVAFTLAATPYFYVRVEETPLVAPTAVREPAASPKVLMVPLSPERGQLLMGLVVAGFPIMPLNSGGAIFDSADLRAGTVRAAQLTGISLWRADLKRADLSESDLSNADLRYADMQHANLRAVKIAGAEADYADFRGADLTNADLSNARLVEADFRESKLRNTILRNALANESYFVRAQLQHADLRGASLYFANLSGADLEGSNLQETLLEGAELQRANLHGANLHGADLNSANLHEADLSDADLRGADLSNAEMENAKLDRAIVGNASMNGKSLPAEFPKGWTQPPSGWKLVSDGQAVRLERNQVP